MVVGVAALVVVVLVVVVAVVMWLLGAGNFSRLVTMPELLLAVSLTADEFELLSESSVEGVLLLLLLGDSPLLDVPPSTTTTAPSGVCWRFEDSFESFSSSSSFARLFFLLASSFFAFSPSSHSSLSCLMPEAHRPNFKVLERRFLKEENFLLLLLPAVAAFAVFLPSFSVDLVRKKSHSIFYSYIVTFITYPLNL